ncbi:MAG: hypothetical protein NUV61_01915 [Candidatus Azambacteria bacterium]|nr:hypothetical protein [Candidatus Azambacteria bacterium]
MKKLFLIVFLLLVATGCTMTTTHITMTDPSHLRVLIKNDSPYKVRMEGPVKGWMEPYSSITWNAECAGKFNGVGHAYKKIGETDKGESALFYMGERVFGVRPDGRNHTYNGESYDEVIAISSFYKYNNVMGEKTHIFYTDPCSILLPDVEFRWGK